MFGGYAAVRSFQGRGHRQRIHPWSPLGVLTAAVHGSGQLRELLACNQFSGDCRCCGKVATVHSPRSIQARASSASAGLLMGPIHCGRPTGDRYSVQGCSIAMVPGPSAWAAQPSLPAKHGADTRMPCRHRRTLSPSSARTDRPGLAVQLEQTNTVKGRSVARRQDVMAPPVGRPIAPFLAHF